MTEETKGNVVDLSSLKGKNGFRKDKTPTKREVFEMAAEDLKTLGEKVKVLEGVLEMTLRRLSDVQNNTQKGNQNLAVLCDSLTIRLVSLSRHLLDKKIIDDKEFADTINSVSIEMIEAKQAELDMQMGVKNVDRPAQKDDVVLIDYVGKIDDVVFEGGSAVRQMVKVGGGGFVDGLDSKVAGMKAGDKTTIDVTFPEDYGNKDLAGKAAKFDIFCRAVKEKVEQPKPTE